PTFTILEAEIVFVPGGTVLVAELHVAGDGKAGAVVGAIHAVGDGRARGNDNRSGPDLAEAVAVPLQDGMTLLADDTDRGIVADGQHRLAGRAGGVGEAHGASPR